MNLFLKVIALAVLLLSTAALAHQCFVANKPAGAGSAGTSTLELNGFDYDNAGVNYNPQGKPTGGFETLTVTVDGNPIGTADVFTHRTLPEGARNAGPGDDGCDGIGVDDLEACLTGP